MTDDVEAALERLREAMRHSEIKRRKFVAVEYDEASTIERHTEEQAAEIARLREELAKPRYCETFAAYGYACEPPEGGNNA